MKRFNHGVKVLLVTAVLAVVALMSSCSKTHPTAQTFYNEGYTEGIKAGLDSVDMRESKHSEPVDDTLRVRRISSGIVLPVLVNEKYNIYKPGDTVWVNQNSRRLTNNSWRTDVADSDVFIKCVIE